MTPAPSGWHPDPAGRHRLRFRTDSGWTAWVADDAGASIDPNGVPPELAPAEGWYPDPGGFRERWWDGKRWTNRVVRSGLRIRYSQPEPGWAPPPAAHGTGAQRELRRRAAPWVVLGVLGACVFVGLFVLGLYAWSQSAEEDTRSIQRTLEDPRRDEKANEVLRHELLDEIDAWHLPETVMLWSRSDEQDFGTSVTRYFVPTDGVDLRRAAEDLVLALRAQGYENLLNTGNDAWLGSCRAASSCLLWIEVEAADNRISVTLMAA